MRDDRRDARNSPRKTGNVIGSFGYDIRHLKRRVERIERRLGIVDEDAQHAQTREGDRDNGNR